jgi:WD40 repeat protein
MNERAAGLPAAGVVRVVGPEEAGAGFLVSPSGLIVTCAHVLIGCVPGATVSIKPYVDGQSLQATVELLQDPPDVAVLRPTAPVPSEVLALPLGRSPETERRSLRTFGYPQIRPEAGLPGELVFSGITAADGYSQLALRSEEATLGFSGAPIWDPELGAVVGMVKSIARGDPGQRLGTTAFGVPVEVIRDLCPELRLPDGCPYRGLEAFTEEHVDYYYGREHATRQLLTSLADLNFVPVVAVSGGGKSSLLQAGLAKGLRDRPVVGLAQRIRCYQRVGSQPHTQLLRSLAQHGILLPDELTVAPPRELAAAIRSAVPPTELIVVVDQFERLYTDCEDAERKRFVALLQCLASDTVKVVIGLRADFYHLALADLGERIAAGQVALAPMSEQDLGRAISAPAEKLMRSFQPGLTQRLIADVRGRPGDLPLLQFALTELWERDAASGVLTVETYRGLGVELPDGTHLPGAQGALIRRAEQLWRDLDQADRPRLQRILLGLIAAQPAEIGAASPVAGTRDLSRPARRAQWALDDQPLIQQLIDARLLTADKAPVGGQPTVEVSHEALLRAWPRLRKWLRERSQFVQWRAQDLAPYLERWLDSNKNPEFLLPRSLLDPALRWLHDYPDELAGPPAEFLRASRAAARIARGRRRTLTVVGAVLVLFAVTAGVFAWRSSGKAGQQHAVALTQHAIALSRQLASASTSLDASDPVTARRLALAALSAYPTSEATTAVVTEVTEQVRDGYLPADPAQSGLVTPGLTGGGVSGAAFSPDGRLLATGGADVRLWDPADGKPVGVPLAVEGSGATGVAFSPDGRLIASADTAGNVQVWNATSGRLDLDLHSGSPGAGTASLFREAVGEDVAFSRDGRLVVSGSSDGYVRIWDVATGKPVGHPIAVDPPPGGQAGLGPGVTAVAFSLDSGLLATAGGSGYVRFWNPLTGAPEGTPLLADPDKATDQGGVVAIAFSRDGSLLATAGRVGQVRIWTVATRSLAAGPLSTFGVAQRGPASCSSLAFSPDGTLLACAQLVTAELFDARTGKYLGGLIEPDIRPGIYAGVNVVAFSPRADLLATGSTNGLATLWNATARTQNGTTVGAQLTPELSQFHNEGVLLASQDTLITGSGSDGYAQLVGSSLPAGANQGAWGITGETFSPDGRLLAVLAGQDLRLLDARTGKPWRKPIVAAPGRADQLAGVVFSPRGDLVATLDTQGHGQLWNTATGASIGQPFTVRGENDVQQLTVGQVVAFSPDGRLLAVASLDGNVRLLSTATGNPVRESVTAGPSPSSSAATGGPPGSPPPPAVIGLTGSVAFSATGRLLASASADGYVRLWNPVTGAPVGSPIAVDPASQEGSSRGVAALTLSPNGRYLATVEGNGQIRLWDTETRLAVGLPLPAGSLNNGYGASFIPAAVAFSADGNVLVSVNQQGDVEAWPTWLLTDPRAALCAQVGPPTTAEWAKYAPGEPEPDMCSPQP